ncbi:hypothetical protein [Thauera sp. SWB20]|uniref:hypothetical protein n=1 Tax=Thauera sp. SWB20 TaxID=1572758 RepID=UPI0012E0666C|nr:hypothetical protein [Thauera sp. SWB20]
MTSMAIQQQRELRAVAMTLLSVKPPVYVTSGGVMAARDYKAKCALVNRFARGGVLNAPVRSALVAMASMHGVAINFGSIAQPCTPPVPVGNTGTTSTGQGV